MKSLVFAVNEASVIDRIKLQADPWVGRILKASMSLCDNPLCPCTSIYVQCEDATPGENLLLPTYSFSLDLQEKGVGLKGKQRPDEASLTLAQVVVEEMGPRDWANLQILFAEEKGAQLHAADLSHQKANFPKVLARDPSMLVSYGIVVPHARPLLFSLEGVTWQAMDDYCINPACTCREVHLIFRSWPSGAPWGPSVHADEHGVGPVLNMELDSQAWKSVVKSPAGLPSLEKLMAALEGAWPALRIMLEERRRILRELFLGQSSSRTYTPVFRPPVPVLSSKVGRNDPCSCGSGIKYKRCCGAN